MEYQTPAHHRIIDVAMDISFDTRLSALTSDLCGWEESDVERYLVDYASLPSPSPRDRESRGLLLLRGIALASRLHGSSALCAEFAHAIERTLNGYPWEESVALPYSPGKPSHTFLSAMRQLNIALAYDKYLRCARQGGAFLTKTAALRAIARAYGRPIRSVEAALTAERKRRNSLLSISVLTMKHPSDTTPHPPHAVMQGGAPNHTSKPLSITEPERSPFDVPVCNAGLRTNAASPAALHQVVEDCGLNDASLAEYREFLAEAHQSAGLGRDDLILFVKLRYFCKLTWLCRPHPGWLSREIRDRTQAVLHGERWDTAFPLVPTAWSSSKRSVQERNLFMASAYADLMRDRDHMWVDPFDPEQPPVLMTPRVAKRMVSACYCISIKTLEAALASMRGRVLYQW